MDEGEKKAVAASANSSVHRHTRSTTVDTKTSSRGEVDRDHNGTDAEYGWLACPTGSPPCCSRFSAEGYFLRRLWRVRAAAGSIKRRQAPVGSLSTINGEFEPLATYDMVDRRKDCSKQFCGSLDGLFHIYHIAVSGEGGYKVSSDDSMHLVEALSVVITKLPSEHAKKVLELVCMPSVTALQELTCQGGVEQIPAHQLIVHIDRLACIFRNLWPRTLDDK